MSVARERPTLLRDADGVQLWHGDGAAADFAGARVIIDPPYGSGRYPTDKPLPDSLFAKMVAEARTCAIFGWPEDLVALCVRLAATPTVGPAALPTEWITWWPYNKCHPRSAGLKEAECVAVFGEAFLNDSAVNSGRG